MSEEANTQLLEKIIRNQRNIIQEEMQRPAEQTPQVWTLYKEVLDYYDKGMKVPDDVTLLLCDDNWGNLRRVPTTLKEKKRQGGWGLYYHVDYVGAPRNSKWINQMPIQHMWEQLFLAATYGMDRLWILNVGDLKPMEYPITLFMDMAWNPSEYKASTITDHTKKFCKDVFGAEQADEAARIINLLCQMNGRCTAELLDKDTYQLSTGEWKDVVASYDQLEMEALRQYCILPSVYKDTYQELILFPLQAMGNLHRMYYAQAMNHYYYQQRHPDTNHWATVCEDAFKRDSLLCWSYNHDIARGKWNGMMIQKHIGYQSWNDDFPVQVQPRVYKLTPEETRRKVFKGAQGVVVMDAEHFDSAQSARQATWITIPSAGRTRSGITLMPYNVPTDHASLTYRFVLPKQGIDSVTVLIVLKSTLDFLNKGGLSFTLQLDQQPLYQMVFNAELNEKPENIYRVYYPMVARRVIVVKKKLPLENRDVKQHTLTVHPNDPAIVFEKIVIDYGGYVPSYLFMQPSELTQ